jgi:predicted branched-subunit amino acid permease
MRPLMMPLPLGWRMLAGYLTADMTFAMMVRRFGQAAVATVPLDTARPLSYFVGLSVVNWTTWNVFSLSGVFLADVIPVDWGLELAGGLALLGLLATLVNDGPKLGVAVAAACIGMATYEWPYRLGIVFSVVVAIMLGGLWDAWSRGDRRV